jgi:2-dehydropantoate 2-reductase
MSAERKERAMKPTQRYLLAGALAGGALSALLAQRLVRAERQRRRNRTVRVLIVGAGVVGSTYARLLARRGMDVTLLVRGERLSARGIAPLQVRDAISRRNLAASVRWTHQVPSAAEYDLVMVAVRFPQLADALATVKPLAETTPVLVFRNSALDAERHAELLGDSALLLGFPATAGARAGDQVRSLPLWLGTTVIGESDGALTQRLQQTAGILRRADLKVEVQARMADWLTTQAAMLAVLAGCVHKTGDDVRNMAQRPDDLGLYLGALSEAYRVLDSSHIPVTPLGSLAAFNRSACLQAFWVRLATHVPWIVWALQGYLASGSEESRRVYEQLLAQAQQAHADVPLLASLASYFEVKD